MRFMIMVPATKESEAGILTHDGSHIAEMTAFLDPAVQGRFLAPDRGGVDRVRADVDESSAPGAR